MTVALNDGNGGFSARRLVVSAEPNGIHTGDYNGDGRLDLSITVWTGVGP